ncbi:MAG: putative DNA modification/repair radical SAM protein [Campylobacterales bacterium]
MEKILQKLSVLTDAAKYDVSCASSGSERAAQKGGLGAGMKSGICHAFSADGRCISLLKILLTNACIYDCAYCVNRAGNDIVRTAFTPQEVATLTIEFYKRNYIEGLFLSSGVVRSPDHTMELMLKAVRILREEHRFGGYIHLKLIPGASDELTQTAAKLADRVSSNIELPSSDSLKLLAPQKTKQSVFAPMKAVRKLDVSKPVSMSTQMIVGASNESDRQILTLSENLYQKALLKRVYYSAYMPINKGLPNLPAVMTAPPFLREHRLYQADWLMRFYGFNATEILDESRPNLDETFDPKTAWALNNLHLFPVEVNRADRWLLLRVPGIGVRGAARIVSARRFGPLDAEALKRLGVIMKRARHFITAGGRYLGEGRLDREPIVKKLLAPKPFYQPPLFETGLMALTGEL